MLNPDRSPIGIGSILVIIMTIVGGVICITDPSTLAFADYFKLVIGGGAVTALAHGVDNGTGNAP